MTDSNHPVTEAEWDDWERDHSRRPSHPVTEAEWDAWAVLHSATPPGLASKVTQEVAMPSTPEFYQDDSGEWRWRAVAPNGRIVADSGEGYKNRGDCEAGYLSATTSTTE